MKIKECLAKMKNKEKKNEFKAQNTKWTFTAEVYDEICKTIGCRRPEYGGLLGSSDGVHIDHYYFDATSERSAGVYMMDIPACNKVIHEWNDNDIELIGVIHSHLNGVTRPSHGDLLMAKNIIESINVHGRFFTPIVQVSPKLNGEIKIYPYSFEQSVEMKTPLMEIETESAEERRIAALDKKAPNRFKRIKRVFPNNLMAKKKVICIGCGGSRPFLEPLARCGVGTFILFDGDVVEDTNIATQGTFISELGKLKVEVIKARILDINPLAHVVCIPKYLDNAITDEDFFKMAMLKNGDFRDTLLCGCTDNFYAQDRCAQLSVKYGIPYLAAQIFEKGKGHEVLFYYPGLTASCPRCILESRYKKMLTAKKTGTGSSEGAAVCVTDYLNSIKSYTALKILCYDEPLTPYYHELDKYADRNYFMTKCSSEFNAPAFEPIKLVEVSETDLTFPFVTIAIGQTPEEGCPLCGRAGQENASGRIIQDTRTIINPYDKPEE